jgi:hypothetical protein
MKPTAVPLFALCAALVIACGSTVPIDDLPCPCASGFACCNNVCLAEGASCVTAATGGGSADFNVTSSVPIAGSTVGSSYTRNASFTRTACTYTTIGACTVDPCYASSSSGTATDPAANAGQVSIGGAQMASLSLNPQGDGTYSQETIDGAVPWSTGAETVTVQWAHAPGNTTAGGGTMTLGTPPYIALAPGSAFADATATLARTQDLTVSWTSDTSPTALDTVSVSLISGSTLVYCGFSVSAGSGVVSAAALPYLGTGAASSGVHSKEYTSQTVTGADGAQWTLGFNVDATARTSYGLAQGSVTIVGGTVSTTSGFYDAGKSTSTDFSPDAGSPTATPVECADECTNAAVFGCNVGVNVAQSECVTLCTSSPTDSQLTCMKASPCTTLLNALGGAGSVCGIPAASDGGSRG